MSSPCGYSSVNADPANETLPSALSNLINDFYGNITKTVVNGRVVWELPCDLSAGLESNPRQPGEGTACYLKRLVEESFTQLPNTQVIAGNALTGGGYLSSSVTIDLDATEASKQILPYYDASKYGVVVEDVSAAAANSAALVALVVLARVSGRGIQLPAGKIYLQDTWDVSGVTEIRGWGTIASPYQTELVSTVQGRGVFVNVSSGTKLSTFAIRPRYFSWSKTDSTGIALLTADSQSDIIIENVLINGFWRGIDASIFDSTLVSLYVSGCHRPLRIRGGGTQNLVERCSFRGHVPVVSANTDTSVVCASYTAGALTFTVTDGTAFAVGDIIWVSSSPTFSNTISAKLWWRRVTNVSGNTITINQPWPYSFSNGVFHVALGSGSNAIETVTECVLSTVNVEWGRWDRIARFTGPAAVSVDGFHIEGWCVYTPGVDTYAFDVANSVASFSYINAWNNTVLDTTGVSFFGDTGGVNVKQMWIRDWDLFQATPIVYVAKNLSQHNPNEIQIDEIFNLGIPLQRVPVTNGQAEARGTTFSAGQEGELVRADGLGNRVFFGYTVAPTYGSFLEGDRVKLNSGDLVCSTRGTYNVAAGNYKIRQGSRVLVVDNAARVVLSQRVPITISGSRYAVVKGTYTSVAATVLTVAASIGDRKIEVNSISNLTNGDWLVLSFGGVGTFEDVQVQRVFGNTVFLSLPLTKNHLLGASVESGYYLDAASTTDVSASVPLTFSTPVFYSHPGNFTASGSVSAVGLSSSTNITATGSTESSLGNASAQRVLTLTGNAVGVRALRMTRPGVGDLGIGVGGDGSNSSMSVWDELTNAGIAGFTGGSSILWTIGSATVAAPKNGFISGQPGVGTDIKGGDLFLNPGAGTGAGTLPSLFIRAPKLGASGATTQSFQGLIECKADETTSDATGVWLFYWNGASWLPKRVHVGAVDSGGVGYRVLRIPN